MQGDDVIGAIDATFLAVVGTIDASSRTRSARAVVLAHHMAACNFTCHNFPLGAIAFFSGWHARCDDVLPAAIGRAIERFCSPPFAGYSQVGQEKAKSTMMNSADSRDNACRHTTGGINRVLHNFYSMTGTVDWW